MSARFYAVASFFAQEDHQLALVKLTADDVSRYQSLREQLAALRRVDRGLCQFVVRGAPVVWLEWDGELQERISEDITEEEYEQKLASRPDEYSEPDGVRTHISEEGISFSCETEADRGTTATIMWATLEQPWPTS